MLGRQGTATFSEFIGDLVVHHRRLGWGLMEKSSAWRIERLFKVALLVKGVDGAAELIAAVVLILVPGTTVHRIVAVVLARDLLGSADGWLARHFITVTDQFAAGNRTFAVVYLGLHGLIKLALVGALLRKWLPAYPVAIAVLGTFVVYELYRATRTGSILLPVLAVVDIAIIVAIVREYRLLRRHRLGLTQHVDRPGYRQ